MSEEIPPIAPEPTSPPAIQRGQIGLNVSLQILLGLVLFGLVNYVGFRYFYQWDKTYNREFTLSKDTLTFLKQLDKKIALTVIAKKDAPEYKDLTQLAETYRREEKTKLKIDIIDPVKDLEAYTKLSQEADKLRIKLDLGFFVRAVANAGDAGEKSEKPTIPAAQFIRQDDLFRYTQDINKRQVLSGFSGEAAFLFLKSSFNHCLCPQPPTP